MPQSPHPLIPKAANVQLPRLQQEALGFREVWVLEPLGLQGPKWGGYLECKPKASETEP